MISSAKDTVRVLMAPGVATAPETVRMLVESLPDGVSVREFSFRRALKRQDDVLHLHWPELVMKHPTARRRVYNSVMLTATVVWRHVRGAPMVWTVHNSEPHEKQPFLARIALRAWERFVDARVFMYEAARFADRRDGDVVIRRGDYAPMLRRLGTESETSTPASGILNFGLVRPYKGIETLIDAYRAIPDAERPPLSICGNPDVDDYAKEIERRAAGVTGVSLELNHVPDSELVDRIKRARLVVLPYRKIYNSGTVLLALSLGRKVLVPDSPTMRELQTEVGGDWVTLFTDLTPQTLLHAYESAPRGVQPPDLSQRDWTHVGQSYADLYRRLAR